MKKFTLLLFIAFNVVAAIAIYLTIFAPNVNSAKPISVTIPTGSSYDDVLHILKENHAIKQVWSFELVSRLKKYPEKVKAGKYQLTPRMNNRQIVNMLRAGLQKPVKLVIYNIRTREEFAGLIGRTLEIDSASFYSVISNPAFCDSLGTDTNNILSRFITDNYELYWNTSISNLLKKFNQSYHSFWNKSRLAKAKALNLSPYQVTTLASIVEKEVIFDKEMPTVAGVYLNRLRIGMPLQADPTLVFATRDFDTRRVKAYHKEFDSPYNTYKYAGLPPGPICMPRKKSIDAVLDAEQHKFVYFCANPDMSGYSIFSETYEQQMKVAAMYRKKLDAMNIR